MTTNKQFIIWLSGLFFVLSPSILQASSKTHIGMSDCQKQAYSEEVFLEADQIEFSQKNNHYIAKGHVEVLYEDYLLRADSLTYNMQDKRMQASGNVQLQQDGNTLFADYIDLAQDLETGFAHAVAARIEKHIKIIANRIERHDENYTTYSHVTYTPCSLAKGRKNPLWQIRADKIYEDRVAKTVTYENPSLEVYGIPIIALPELYHPTPDVKRQTGFLIPRFRIDSNNGPGLSVPYFWNLSESEDITFQPTIFTQEYPLLQGEYRQRTLTGQYSIYGAGTISDRRDQNNRSISDHQPRSTIISQGRFSNSPYTEYGWDLQRSSDDTFLKRYRLSYQDDLQSRAFYEYGKLDRSFGANSFLFQSLRPTDNNGLTPMILPLLEGYYRPDTPVAGGFFTWEGSFLALHRTEGLDTRRLTNQISWQRRDILPGGLIITPTLGLRGDVYHISNDIDPLNPNLQFDSGLHGRFIPQAALDIQRPMYRERYGFYETLTPHLQFITAPSDWQSENLPNEDSSRFEFDELNLFNFNRYPGQDRIETGTRLNAGTSYRADFGNSWVLDAIAGQSFRLDRNRQLYKESGLSGRISDYVVGTQLQAGENWMLLQRLRLDNRDFSAERSETIISLIQPRWGLSTSYTRLAANSDLNIQQPRSEIMLAGRISPFEEWHFNAGMRKDTENGKSIETRFGIIYVDECFIMDFGIGRRFTRDRDLEPNTSVSLRLQLRSFGGEAF